VDLSSTEAVILGVLARQPASGYDVRAWLEDHGAFVGYRTSMSPIYRTLARLQSAGLLEFTVRDGRNGPDAKVYRLTPDGRAAIMAWARSPFVPSARPMDPDFTLRFVLGGQFGRDIAIDILRTELDYRLKQRVESQWSVDTAAEPVPELDPAWCAEIQTLAHERGYASTAAYIAWLELTLARIQATH